MYTQRTFNFKKNEYKPQWYLVNAEGKTVCRLASEIASYLSGKRNPGYTPHIDSGDAIVVVNAEKVEFKGKKWQQKKYFWHSGYVGGIKSRTAIEQKEKHPELILYNAVKVMLPKNKLAADQLKRLKLFKGSDHQHSAQNPVELNLGE